MGFGYLNVPAVQLSPDPPRECLRRDQFLSPSRHHPAHDLCRPGGGRGNGVQLTAAMELDAVVLFDALSQQMIAGLTAGERAVRVARRAGAARVLVVDRVRDQLAAWRGARRCPLLVLRADQLVHPPLVTPLVGAAPADGLAIAVRADGAYAGALLATGEHAGRVIEALARGDGDAAIARAATLRVPHAEIARHPIATPDERRAAHRLLY